MKYLLDLGVDVNSVDSENQTALHFLARHRHHPDTAKCISLLFEHGADLNIRECNGMTPLMESVVYKNMAPMAMFLKSGRCNLEIKAYWTKYTAILLAACGKKWDFVELLLSHHASPIAKDYSGQSLLDLATKGQAPLQILHLIQDTLFDRERPRLLYRARTINNAMKIVNSPVLRKRLPRVEVSAVSGNEEVLHAVLQYTLGMKEDGSLGGGMLEEHLVVLWDMLLPVWDEERNGAMV
jgi:ankyrin repeat protein